MIKKQTKNELITASLLDLLENNKSFNSITIQDITDNCEISRRTFYNCFKDKYDIITQFYEDSSQIQVLEDTHDLYAYLLASCMDKATNKSIWKKILKDQTCFKYLEPVYYNIQCRYIERHIPLSTYEKALLNFYSTGLFRTQTDWIQSGCQIATEQIATILLNTVPSEIKNIYQNICQTCISVVAC